MKLKSIFAAAAFCVALSSCGPKEKPLAEQLVGQWTGMDSITVTTVDSTGILSEPGDKLEARVTNSNRKVVKIQKDNGNSKI